jgi:hypothetical protein
MLRALSHAQSLTRLRQLAAVTTTRPPTSLRTRRRGLDRALCAHVGRLLCAVLCVLVVAALYAQIVLHLSAAMP